MARECFTQWMRAHGGAIVIIVADLWQGMPTMGHSGAARAGMVNFTETAAGEWAASGVRVNAVAPGWIASSGMDHYPPEMGEHIRAMKDKVPMISLGASRGANASETNPKSRMTTRPSGVTSRFDGLMSR